MNTADRLLARCKRMIERGDAYVNFARLNDDSSWTIEIIETHFVARTKSSTRHMLKSISAREALYFLRDLVDSAQTEANGERK